jgi:hypothetical protein
LSEPSPAPQAGLDAEGKPIIYGASYAIARTLIDKVESACQDPKCSPPMAEAFCSHL